ncbi:MAG: NAD(P)/FAD-dependent oxidoreductase [Rhodospirillaceae bacterium]|nr:NAD(P)/FAD-dependent oxidoreductase [Rhodospirillaceae bacterium]
MAAKHHQILIVGGGAAGITVAARLRKTEHDIPLDIAIVDPADSHYYQAAFTLVGGGAYDLEDTRRNEADLIPQDVTWVKDAVSTFAPDSNSVSLTDGTTITYDYLVVCPGLQINWSGIPGLKEYVGRYGVCSNYSANTVEYTFEVLKNLKPGARALFTQAPMPIKCPGAPQKIVYLAADHLTKRGIRTHCDVRFLTATPAIFGVPFYAKELVKVAARYNVPVSYNHNLVEIDGRKQKATFAVTAGDQQGQTVTLDFDMLHVTPPQSAPDFVKTSPLANTTGFVDVHANSLQHLKYKNVFSLGDAAGTANSKTAAAVRKQAPVVVRNLRHLLRKEAVEEGYDGYGACPLTTAYGKVLMAEFIYGGKPTPTLPLDPRKERYVNWWIKTTGLPMLYWDYMLKGREAFPSHNTAYVDPAA